MITIDVISKFSQCFGAIGFLIFLVFKIKNYAPKDEKSSEKYKLAKQKKIEEINIMISTKKYSSEDIKDRVSIIDIELTILSNNTSAMLFFIPLLYGLISPYTNNSIDVLDQFTSICILLIAGFIYPYLGYKNDKTYDLKVELHVLEDRLKELENAN